MARLLPFVLLAALAAVAVGLAAWTPGDKETGAAHVAVEVTGPDGVLFQGTVEAGSPTALGALRAAAEAAGLAVETRAYSGLGSGCRGVYVEQVGPYRAEGSAGWVYEVRDAGQDAWRRPMHSAACEGLDHGNAVRWLWTDGA